MKEVLKYLADHRFYVPAGFLVLFELFLQSGLYRHVLRPNSYADNFNRIISKTGKSHLKPNVLILGTSVAYQGINVRLLNRRLEGEGLVAQSAACQGAQLITQNLLYRSAARLRPSIALVVHVAEDTSPWSARFSLDEPNRSMLAQGSRFDVFPMLRSFDYRQSQQEWFYFILRSVTYQRDLRDLLLDPADRIKGVSRRLRAPHSDHVYENRHVYRISAYGARNLQECMEIAARGIPDYNANDKCVTAKNGQCISDRHHRLAVLRTCRVGMQDPLLLPGGDQWSALYFKRFKLFYDELHADGRRAVIVLPPLANLIRDVNADRRTEVWKRNIKRLYGDRVPIIDLRKSLDGPRNGDLYYDTIHLNRDGAALLTDILALELKKVSRMLVHKK